MLGHWLNGSGWIQCLVQAGVATAGVADSFITAAHVRRTRYTHAVTPAALFNNLRELHEYYCNSETGDAIVTFARWRAIREEASVLFKYWSTDNLPPTSDAFLIHVKRAVYQAAHCWLQSAETASSAVHDSATWGWCESDEKWTPVWMTLPEVSDTCRDLIRCSCKRACTSHCKCTQAYLPCTGLCHCDGECTRS